MSWESGNGTYRPLLYNMIPENMVRTNCNISQYSCLSHNQAVGDKSQITALSAVAVNLNVLEGDLYNSVLKHIGFLKI